MNLAEELQKLADLYDDGVLTEAEFTEAKRQLLQPTPPKPESPAQDPSLGSAVDKYVDYQIASGIIGLVLFLFWMLFVISQVRH